MDVDKLILKAKKNELNKKEIEYIKNKALEENNDLYHYLYMLGISKKYEYEYIFEKHLKNYEKPEIIKISLQTLCRFWNKTDKYINYVLEYYKQNDWDDFGDTRLMAISILGDYLHTKKKLDDQDKLVIKNLLINFNNADNDETLRRSCYEALVSASGKNIYTVELFEKQFNVDKKVIEWATDLCKN